MSLSHNLYCYWASTKVAATSSRDDTFTTWEERAFAEDSGRDLGSIWPPRSYSCSFCGREFRSAQALGGHMNVHRRDRARLKLSQSSQSDGETQVVIDHHDKERSVPSSVISHSDSDRDGVSKVLSRSLLPVMRSAVSDSDPMFPSSPYWSLVVRKQDDDKGSTMLGTRPSRYPTIVEATKNITNANRNEKPLCINEGRIYAHHIAPSVCCIDEASNFKRAKIFDSCISPRFLFERLFAEDYSYKLEVTRVKVENREEIDLELRLGNPPEVK